MNFNFDKIIDRSENCSVKWDEMEEKFGNDDLLPFWIADMDFESPEVVVDAILKKAKQGVYGYTKRPKSYNEAVINWVQKRHNWKIKSDWINFSPGIVPALNFIIRAYTNRGDRVIIQSPVYYPFYQVIENNGCHVYKNSLKLKNGSYEMDFEDFAEKAKDDRTKIFILCSPHNPVGRVWTKEELKRIGEICLENDVLVIADEIHNDLVYEPYTHTPFASINEDFAQNSITCISPSKSFNIAGLQASSIIIPNEKLQKMFDTMIGTFDLKRNNAISVSAVEAAYREGEDWLEEVIKYLSDNIEYLIDYFDKNISGVDVIEPEGTYLVWLDFRELGLNKEELHDLLVEKAGIALDDGHWFGEEGEGFARINVACPKSFLEKGIKRIEAAINSL